MFRRFWQIADMVESILSSLCLAALLAVLTVGGAALALALLRGWIL